MPTYYLGLDAHKVRTQYCLMDPAGGIVPEGSVLTEEVPELVPDRGASVGACLPLCARIIKLA